MPPRFSPRDWVLPSTAFGTVQEVEWLEPSTRQEAEQVVVAHFLHEACREVGHELSRRKMTKAALAERLGERPATLRRKLNGEYPATHEDLIRWALVLEDPEVIFAPGRVDDLLPPGLDDVVPALLSCDES